MERKPAMEFGIFHEFWPADVSMLSHDQVMTSLRL